MAEKKLEIFKVLENISRKNRFYDGLTDEEQKSVQPFVIMRWLTGCSSAQQIYFLNEFVNPYVYSLSKHKELLCDLLSVCTLGRNLRYKWVPPVANTKMFPNISELIASAMNCKVSEATDLIFAFTDEEILEIADELGRQAEDIAKIKKELRTRPNRS